MEAVSYVGLNMFTQSYERKAVKAIVAATIASCQTPQPNFLFKFRLADKKIQLISGLAEYSRNLRNSAGIWLTTDKFG